VLWRRSKLGLHLTPAERAVVADWCAAHWPNAATDAAKATEQAWS
jgi:glycerol-3-phosphate dehydrogenase